MPPCEVLPRPRRSARRPPPSQPAAAVAAAAVAAAVSAAAAERRVQVVSGEGGSTSRGRYCHGTIPHLQGKSGHEDTALFSRPVLEVFQTSRNVRDSTTKAGEPSSPSSSPFASQGSIFYNSTIPTAPRTLPSADYKGHKRLIFNLQKCPNIT